MLFGVPDEITDMTRSLEMVERCSGGTGYVSGHRKGVLGTPSKDLGLVPNGPRGEREKE